MTRGLRSGRRAVAAALVLAGTLLAGCARHGEDEGGAAPGTAVVPVRVATVAVRTFTDLLQAPGQWRSSGDVVVPAPFAAVVESLSARPGDRVRTGEVLGVLLTRESRSAVRGAEL